MNDVLLSRIVRASSIKEQEQTHEVVADTTQCAAIAAEYGLDAVKTLRGKFTLVHEHGGIIAARLRIVAQVSQICVVTLEPFPARIEEDVKLRFIPAALAPEDDGEGEFDLATLDEPDEIPYGGDNIDLGAALLEQFALGLDPYPRKPGAELPEEVSEPLEHPFARLAQRKDAGKSD